MLHQGVAVAGLSSQDLNPSNWKAEQPSAQIMEEIRNLLRLGFHTGKFAQLFLILFSPPPHTPSLDSSSVLPPQAK